LQPANWSPVNNCALSGRNAIIQFLHLSSSMLLIAGKVLTEESLSREDGIAHLTLRGPFGTVGMDMR
jgi:hypothetical protein